jgi:LysM repeat protein
VTHFIQAGETIWALSRRYGASVEAIIEASGIEDVRRIPVGRPILIPPPEPTGFAPVPREDFAASRPGPSETLSRPKPAAPEPDFSHFEELLRRVEEQLRAARFEEALGTAGEAREHLGTLADSQESERRRAELEVLAGTAEVALDRYGDALASFRRALEADPDLQLDARKTSPKVLRVLDETRSRHAVPADGSAASIAPRPAPPSE